MPGALQSVFVRGILLVLLSQPKGGSTKTKKSSDSAIKLCAIDPLFGAQVTFLASHPILRAIVDVLGWTA